MKFYCISGPQDLYPGGGAGGQADSLAPSDFPAGHVATRTLASGAGAGGSRVPDGDRPLAPHLPHLPTAAPARHRRSRRRHPGESASAAWAVGRVREHLRRCGCLEGERWLEGDIGGGGERRAQAE